MIEMKRTFGDKWFYVLAALSGIGIGWVQVAVDDLSLTALLVVMAAMLLGILRPRWPWRWAVMLAIFIPLEELAAYALRTVKPTRAQIYGSFLAFLPGIVGGYVGAFLRRAVENLRQGKQ
jgi:hypothetical protein